MSRTVIFLVVTCAGAVFGTPYYQSLLNYKLARQTLEDNVLSTPEENVSINDMRRHYLVITNFIAHFAYTLSGCLGVPYDDAYLDELRSQIPYALQNSGEVIRRGIRMANETDESISNLVELINLVCQEVPANICDIQLDFIISLDMEKYGKEAEILLALGVASDDFNMLAPTILEKAETYGEIGYLINNGLNDLRSVISDLSSVIRLLVGPIRSC